MSPQHDPTTPGPHADGEPADPRPVPPEAPLPSECCESGCPICVHDLHAEAMAQYRLDLAAWEARQAQRSAQGRDSG